MYYVYTYVYIYICTETLRQAQLYEQALQAYTQQQFSEAGSSFECPMFYVRNVTKYLEDSTL